MDLGHIHIGCWRTIHFFTEDSHQYTFSLQCPERQELIPVQLGYSDLFKCNFHLPHTALQVFTSGNCWVRFLPENVVDVQCLGKGIRHRGKRL